MAELETHFKKFFEDTVGHNAVIETPFGHKKLVYADWAASGRLYRPIEEKLLNTFGPLVANTHTESNTCGEFMTAAYHEARHVIKKHVGATESDVLLTAGSGMTSAVVLLQRLLGWRIPEQYISKLTFEQNERPIVFVSEMEHHSNHTTWIETIADVVVIPSSKKEPFDLMIFEKHLKECKNHKTKIAAVTAASNVTGVQLLVHDIAELIHKYGGLCFIDYTCAAPYTPINMHPKEKIRRLDAIYFSPHKFLGGPGTPGILVFDQALYRNKVPDRPGGGTVSWTNPWGGRRYFNDIEVREDGGTPPFLGLIKTALAVNLKGKMGVGRITEREEELVEQVFGHFENTPGLSILDPARKKRLSLFAFTIDGLHYNLVTRMLNDRYGIQARGGCACAGTYGHCLFKIPEKTSKKITDKIDHGDLSGKPGFTRVSLHPTVDNKTAEFITGAIKDIALNGKIWAKDYSYDHQSNEFFYKKQKPHFAASKVFSV